MLVLAIIASALAAFLLLGRMVVRHPDHPLDEQLVRTLRTADGQPVGPRWLPAAARDVTALGSTAILTPIAALAAVFLMMQRRAGAAALVVFTSISAIGLNAWLKQEFGRVRPDLVLRLVEIDSPSFPSGHATASAAIYTTVALLAARSTAMRRDRIFLVAVALAATGGVGLSRVYLGVHYPSDVAAGWALGLGWAVACHTAARQLERRGIGPPGAW